MCMLYISNIAFFYRKINTVVALTVLINHLYSKEQFKEVKIFYAYINLKYGSYGARDETII